MIVGERDDDGLRAHRDPRPRGRGGLGPPRGGRARPGRRAWTTAPGELWPPAGAEPLDTAGLYDRLAELGFGYGPAFQGATAAWRRGDEVYAEVALDERQSDDAAALRRAPGALRRRLPRGDRARTPGAAVLVRGRATASARALRRCGSRSCRPARAAFTLRATDATGTPVLCVDSLATRPIDPAQLRAARATRPLYGLGWTEIAAAPGDGPRRRRSARPTDFDGLDAVTTTVASDDAARGSARGARARARLARARGRDPADRRHADDDPATASRLRPDPQRAGRAPRPLHPARGRRGAALGGRARRRRAAARVARRAAARPAPGSRRRVHRARVLR